MTVKIKLGNYNLTWAKLLVQSYFIKLFNSVTVGLIFIIPLYKALR